MKKLFLPNYFSQNKINIVLFWISLSCDLIFPFFIWKYNFPIILKSIPYLLCLIIVLQVIFRRVFISIKLTGSFLIILLISIQGIIVSFLNSQNVYIIIYAWFVLFRGPLIAYYFKDQYKFGNDYVKILIQILLMIIIFELCFQLYEYLEGSFNMDQRGGSLGEWSTQYLIILEILCLSIMIGFALFKGKYLLLTVSSILVSFSSLLGEMKLFPYAIFIMAILSIIIYVILNRKESKTKIFRTVGIFSLIMIVPLFIYLSLYNKFILPTAGKTFVEISAPKFIKQQETSVQKDTQGNYDVGRTTGIIYVFNQIKTNPVTMIFGEGIGSRSESKSLHILGKSLEKGAITGLTRSSLIIIFSELGIIGILLLFFSMINVIFKLFKMLLHNIQIETACLIFGLLIFTILAPVWLWYGTSWTYPLVLYLYWINIGYIFNRYNTSKMNTHD